LVLIDYTTSDRTNIDEVQVNLTSYDLGQQYQEWSTTIFQSSIHNTNVNLIPGSLSLSSDQYHFILSLRFYRVFDIQYLLIANTIDLISGQVLDQHTEELSCSGCDYRFYQLGDKILVTDEMIQDNSTVWQFQTLDNTEGEQISNFGEISVGNYVPLRENLVTFGINREVVQNTITRTEASILAVSGTGKQLQLHESSLHNSTWSRSTVVGAFLMAKYSALILDYQYQEILFPDRPTLLDRYLVLFISFTVDQISSLLVSAQDPLLFYGLYSLISGSILILLYRQYRLIVNADRSDEIYPRYQPK
jgi:hypothetical protein